MGALGQRVLTAGVLAPLVIGAVLWLPPVGFQVLLGAILLLGAWEWAGLVGLAAQPGCLGLIATVAGLLGLAAWALAAGWGPLPLLIPALLWWLWVAWDLARRTRISPATGSDWGTALLGALILAWAWSGLVWLRDQVHGPWLVLFLLTLIWVGDTAAYFAGRRWGRHKLAPLVSPGKTWAGVYGALAGALLWGGLLAWAYPGLTGPRQAGLVLLAVLTLALSIVGDLYESLLKRRRGIKDSGALLPGHGGLLDRIDSLLAAAPLFALGWQGWVA